MTNMQQVQHPSLVIDLEDLLTDLLDLIYFGITHLAWIVWKLWYFLLIALLFIFFIMVNGGIVVGRHVIHSVG